MASNLYFSRDTKLFAVFKNTGGTVATAAFEIPILDGFSFSQANNTSEITLSEMESSGGISRRGRRLFNDSLAPAEWSFSTYVRPFASNGTDYTSTEVHAVEEVLWAQMAGGDTYNGTDEFVSTKFSGGPVTVSDPTDLNIAFTQSNRAVLHPIDLYFVMETNSQNPVVYKLVDACVSEATLNFDVDGIATVEWSGFAKDIKDWTATTVVYGAALAVTTADNTAGTVNLDFDNDNAFSIGTGAAQIAAKDEGVSATNNFIRNRLTQLSITAGNTTVFPGAGSGVYNITLTGGSITVSNNIEYLTPEEIGKVNIPLENVTGARSVTGSFTCYLDYNDAANSGTSSDFFNDFKAADALNIVTNEFALGFDIGGTSSTTRLEANLGKAHIEIPVTNIEDVISYEVSFHGLGTNISSTDEITLAYFGETPDQ